VVVVMMGQRQLRRCSLEQDLAISNFAVRIPVMFTSVLHCVHH